MDESPYDRLLHEVHLVGKAKWWGDKHGEKNLLH